MIDECVKLLVDLFKIHSQMEQDSCQCRYLLKYFEGIAIFDVLVELIWGIVPFEDWLPWPSVFMVRNIIKAGNEELATKPNV